MKTAEEIAALPDEEVIRLADRDAGNCVHDAHLGLNTYDCERCIARRETWERGLKLMDDVERERFARKTESDLRDGMTDSTAGLSYRIACEDELKRRGLPTRGEDGEPIG